MKHLLAVITVSFLLSGCSVQDDPEDIDPAVKIVLSEVLVSQRTGCAFALGAEVRRGQVNRVKVRQVPELSQPTCPIEPTLSMDPIEVDDSKK